MFNHRYRLYIIFTILLAGGLGLVFLVSNNYYPILLVNGEPISAHRFWAVYQSAARYYQNVLTTYASQSSSSLPNLLSGGSSQRQLEASVLDQLVEASLIAEGIRQEVGPEADTLVAGRIKKYRDNANLSRAAQALYGLSYSDFEAEVLIPQAQKDIMSGRLFLKGQKIEDWLVQARTAAQVTIFSSAFSWDGKAVTIKK